MLFTATIEVKEEAVSVKHFRIRHPNAIITEIDSRAIDGFCEGCDQILYELTIYHTDVEGCKLCPRCWANEDKTLDQLEKENF